MKLFYLGSNFLSWFVLSWVLGEKNFVLHRSDFLGFVWVTVFFRSPHVCVCPVHGQRNKQGLAFAATRPTGTCKAQDVEPPHDVQFPPLWDLQEVTRKLYDAGRHNWHGGRRRCIPEFIFFRFSGSEKCGHFSAAL